VDRALLRLAHYEMTSGRTPPRVVVNETVELAKHFSTEKAPAFINALLDKVMKRIQPA
jgi:Transcription termination factor